VGGLAISPVLDDGGFDSYYKPGIGGSQNVFLPKTITLSTTLTILHQHNLGWNNGEWMGPSEFPYQTQGDFGDIAEVASPGIIGADISGLLDLSIEDILSTNIADSEVETAEELKEQDAREGNIAENETQSDLISDALNLQWGGHLTWGE